MATAAASPAPPRTAGRHRDHPPYKEMILRAVTDLKDRKGSSRNSISKYIAANFSDLPPTHDALLSTHIRRLRKKGLIIMVRHSYMLPGPDVAGAQSNTLKPRGLNPNPGISIGISRRPGRPPRVAGSGAPPVAKRRPGRPPKIAGPGAPPVAKRRPGRPPGAPAPGAPPVEKRRPGRPPKAASGILPDLNRRPERLPKLPLRGAFLQGASLLGKKRPGRPLNIHGPGPSLAIKRRPGRPPKLTVPGPSSTGKSRPGRPPKNLVAGALPAEKSKPGRPPKNLVAGETSAEKSKPGRPRKAPVLGETSAEKRRPGRPWKTRPLSTGPVKKPGRPHKNPVFTHFRGTTAVSEPSAAAIGAIEKSRPGRPRRFPQSTAVSVYRNNASGVVLILPKRLKPGSDWLLHATRKAPSNKRRPGRPKKDSSVSSAAAVTTLAGKKKDSSVSSAAAVTTLAGKRKRGWPSKLSGNVDPGNSPMLTGANGSARRRKPGRPRKVALPLPYAKAVNGNAAVPNRLHQLVGIAIGEAETDLSPVPAAKALVEMKKGGQPRNVLSPYFPEAIADGNFMETGFDPTSIEKRNRGRPRKVPTISSLILAADVNASLDPAQPPSGKEMSDIELGPYQMPAAANASTEIQKPGWLRKVSSSTSDSVPSRGNGTLLNPMQSSPENVTEGLEPYSITMPADLTTTIKKRKPGRPRKVSPSSALVENNGGVPSVKRRGRPPKRSSFF